MAEQRAAYLTSKADECVANENYLGAVDYYTQLHDHIFIHTHTEHDLYIVADKIVKLLNAAAMKYIQDGTRCIFCYGINSS